MNPSRRKDLLLSALVSLVSVIVGLVMIEGMLRFFDYADCPAFRADPSYGYLMSPEQMVSTHGYRFHINQYGLRGPDFSPEVAAGTVRIAFVGDSITFAGGRVRDEDMFVDRTATLLAAAKGIKVESINVSTPGWGIQNMDGYLAANGVHGAKTVVWVIPAIDFRRKKSSLEDFGFFDYKPSLRLSCLCRATTDYAGVIGDKVSARFRKAKGHPGLAILPANLDAFKDGLEHIKQSGASAYVFFVPDALPGPAYTADLARYRAIAESMGVPAIDLSAEFAGNRDQSLFIDGVHLSDAGHRLVAASIAKELETAN